MSNQECQSTEGKLFQKVGERVFSVAANGACVESTANRVQPPTTVKCKLKLLKNVLSHKYLKKRQQHLSRSPIGRLAAAEPVWDESTS